MSKNIFDSIWDNATTGEKERLLLEEMNGLVPVIVYVDDDTDALEIFKFNAKNLGIEAFTASDTGVTLEFISKNKSRILFIVSDFQMPVMDGFEFRSHILNIAPEIPFAILSGHVDREMALKGLEHKINAFLNKPFKIGDLQAFMKKEGE